MKACVILHNMIIEDERDMNLEFFFDNVGIRVRPERNPDRIQAFLETYRQIEDSATHTQLNKDLIAPLAASRGKMMPSFIHSFHFLLLRHSFAFRTIHYLFKMIVVICLKLLLI
jgi:hypothetical protein